MPRPRTILLSLLLGALTTTAIAWALACTNIPSRGIGSSQTIHPAPGPVQFYNIGGPAGGITVTTFRALGRTHIRSTCFGPEFPMVVGSAWYFYQAVPTAPDQLVPWSLRSTTTPWLTNPASNPWPRSGDIDWREVEASGFPLLALASIHQRTQSYTQQQTWSLPLPGNRMRTFGEHSWGPSSPCVLPLRPLFPGFLLNTVLYTALWYPILLIPGALRRALRRRRDLCPHCNYDLRATPPQNPCPECGRPAGPRNSTTAHP